MKDLRYKKSDKKNWENDIEMMRRTLIRRPKNIRKEC